MNDFSPVYPDISNLDPYKHVKYSNGLVLGVDEFNQEELYLLEKHRLHNRTLHGYGTVCGLKLSAELFDGSWEITVAPGIAVNPRGQEIRVPEAQCSLLDTWIYNHSSEIEDFFGAPVVTPPSVPLSVYLVLCYSECETDFVPVPSGPCQSLDKTSVASRIADDFELVWQLTPPAQMEDHAIRDFIQLLRSIEISGGPDGLTVERMEQLVRGMLQSGSPPVYSPPIPNMYMHPDDVPMLAEAAFRTWITEVKPQLLAAGKNCAMGPPHENCVLLGRIDCMVDNSSGVFRIDSPVEIVEEERPVLLQTRLLHELLMLCCGGGGPGPMTSPPMSGFFDESNIMHLTGAETVEGLKRFTDPITLGADGRVTKRVTLPPYTGMPVNTSAEPDFFNASTPSLRFVMGGEAAFTLPIPDDIDYSVSPRIRLVWGVKTSLASVDFTWHIRNRFAEELSSVSPYIGNGGDISGTVTSPAAGIVYATHFNNLPDSITPTDIFGGLRITLEKVDPIDAQLFLLHAEIIYEANRLGGPLT
ncbi:MAG: hypothetical protein OEZ39_14585 [Gammaproteobacteria bacterium]|nr:hypothetical protein [Gammaproteobacteria bacterium]MDH5653080.1 hypothetical protein [Gammaproteobacteria bacterium]